VSDKAIDWDATLFDLCLARSAPDLWPMLEALYGTDPGYARFADDLLAALRAAHDARSPNLKRLDLVPDLEPDWFQRPRWQAMSSTSTVSPER